MAERESDTVREQTGGERPEREQPTIYRCGWCGHPTDASGEPIKENPKGYLAAYPDAREELVQGACCPNGNE